MYISPALIILGVIVFVMFGYSLTASLMISGELERKRTFFHQVVDRTTTSTCVSLDILEAEFVV